MEAFEWSILYKGTSDPDIQLNERKFISDFNSMDPEHGYNMTPGGDGGAGKTLSAAHVEKLKLNFAGQNNPQYGKYGQDHPAFGNKHTEETKKKISIANKGKIVSEASRKKLSDTRKRLFADQVARRKAELEQQRKIRREEFKRRVANGDFKGEKARASKLTDKQRFEICTRRHARESYKSISIDYNIALTSVKYVCETWGPENGFPFIKINADRKTKLTDKNRYEICTRYLKGEKMPRLAEEYGVGETTIHTVIRVWGPNNGF